MADRLVTHCRANTLYPAIPLDNNLHSPNRRLIELQIEHSDLNALIDRAAEATVPDELLMKRLKKRRLKLRDDLVRLQNLTDPDDQA